MVETRSFLRGAVRIERASAAHERAPAIRRDAGALSESRRRPSIECFNDIRLAISHSSE